FRIPQEVPAMAAFSAPSPGQDDPVLAEINVTPLVDVMLVLLIIFMITAPMLHQGIEVALPQADSESLPMRVDDPLVLSINLDGLVYVQSDPVHPSQLVERLLPLLEARQDKAVFLKGDRELAYGKVVEVLDILHRGGITQIGMVTERPRSS
ncbi:MAG: ExbD/TolR family protein, partial [Thermoanaerobaculia bacterium]